MGGGGRAPLSHMAGGRARPPRSASMVGLRATPSPWGWPRATPGHLWGGRASPAWLGWLGHPQRGGC
jgi:hypothetical protein